MHELGEYVIGLLAPDVRHGLRVKGRAVGAVAGAAHLRLGLDVGRGCLGSWLGSLGLCRCGKDRSDARSNDGRYATRQHGFPPVWAFSVSDDRKYRRMHEKVQ